MNSAFMFPIHLAVNKIEKTHRERRIGSKSEKERGQVKSPTREVELTHSN